MRQAVVGILAHVDAGKTTLAEAMLYEAGAIRSRGRVDRGDSHLDTDGMERSRGITIFSSTAALDWSDVHLMLVDAPGHVDFSAEAERTLRALDYAILVVGANDGIQGHTRTLWGLLERYSVPVFVFVNKMDLAATAGTGADEALAALREGLSPSCFDGEALLSDASVQEEAALADEASMDEFLAEGALGAETLRRLVAGRSVFPCFFGSALRDEGVSGFLDGIAALAAERAWPEAFAARVYRVSRNGRGERLAWLKVTGGALRAKMTCSGSTRGEAWVDKVDQVRIYEGDSFETVAEVPAGRICAVTGLAHVVPGSALGAEPAGEAPVLSPVLSFSVDPRGADVHTAFRALRELADEDPMLGVAWSEHLQEIQVQLMGDVQREVVAELMRERYGIEIGFGPGGILYKETISAPVTGIGHFEPLRHYAEVHLLLEPLPRGAGVQVGTRCPVDELDLNWQRLILTHVLEREHLGVLTGSPITDVRITLTAGRAHAKHTEGGDFRQATYRAIRQGLMRAGSILLEPWYSFELQVPADKVGRALADLQRMAARFDPPSLFGGRAALAGEAPASEMQDYGLAVSGYTGGTGQLSLAFAGYRECHDADRVVERGAYDPEADLENTPDSVFCSHGAGYTVKWRDVPAAAHVGDDPSLLRPWRAADASFFAG